MLISDYIRACFHPLQEHEVWPYGLRQDFTYMTAQEIIHRVDDRVFAAAFGPSVFRQMAKEARRRRAGLWGQTDGLG